MGLILDSSPGGDELGVYNLEDGVLTAPLAWVGWEYGRGRVMQTGGAAELGRLEIGYADGVGTYVLADGRLTIGGECSVGEEGLGSLIHRGGTFSAVSLHLGAGRNEGQGRFRVETSQGFINLGQYAQGGFGRLEIALGSLEHTLIDATDEASLAGELLVELIDGFVPDYDDVITILEADGGVSSEFEDTLPGSGLISFDVVYNPNSVQLTHFVIPEPATLLLLSLGGLAVVRRRR